MDDTFATATAERAGLERCARHDQHADVGRVYYDAALRDIAADLERAASAAEGSDLVPPGHLLAALAAQLRHVVEM